MYLDDAIDFDVSPLEHVRTLRESLSRLRKHDLKLSPSKARLGATELDFVGHSISPAGLHPDTNKVRAMTEMPMPTNISQLRSLLGGLSYYRKFSSNAQRTLPRPAALSRIPGVHRALQRVSLPFLLRYRFPRHFLRKKRTLRSLTLT